MAVAGCASEGANDAAHAGDGTEYTEAAAMSIHLAEPERALSIIDSVVIRYATEASRLAHALGHYHYVGKMEGYIAHAQALTGHTGLQLCSNAAEMRGRYADALHYANRASVVRDSHEYYNQREQLNELATVYHL